MKDSDLTGVMGNDEDGTCTYDVMTNLATAAGIMCSLENGGLVAIPFIHCTDYLLDNSIRKFY